MQDSAAAMTSTDIVGQQGSVEEMDVPEDENVTVSCCAASVLSDTIMMTMLPCRPWTLAHLVHPWQLWGSRDQWRRWMFLRMRMPL
jgi:hypothetical protein